MRISIFMLLSALLLAHPGSAIAEVSVTTDKPVYEVGEIVRITAHNTGPGDEQLVSAPFFVIWNLDVGACVYGCLGLPVVTPFPAGQTISLEWDTGLHSDSLGNYAVSVATLDGPSTSYVLTAGVPNDQSSWTTLKARHR